VERPRLEGRSKRHADEIEEIDELKVKSNGTVLDAWAEEWLCARVHARCMDGNLI